MKSIVLAVLVLLCSGLASAETKPKGLVHSAVSLVDHPVRATALGAGYAAKQCSYPLRHPVKSAKGLGHAFRVVVVGY